MRTLPAGSIADANRAMTQGVTSMAVGVPEKSRSSSSDCARHSYSLPLYPHQLPLDFSCDPGLARSGQHIHFTADTEFRQVDAGLDGEAGVGQNLASVVRLKVV